MSKKEKALLALMSQNWYPLFCLRFREDNGYEFSDTYKFAEGLVSGAFPWANTAEGHDYWRAVNRAWSKIYRELI